MNPFISVRYNAPAGSNLACFFPGFRVPSSSSTTIYAKFHWNPMHHFKNGNNPYDHYSRYTTQSNSISLTTTGRANSMRNNDESGIFWPTSGEVVQSKRYYLYLRQYATYNDPYIYYSAYYPKTTNSICSSTTNYYHCRVYYSFVNRRYFVVSQIKGTVSDNTYDLTANFPISKDASNSFYSVYIGWTRGGISSYYAEASWNPDPSRLT